MKATGYFLNKRKASNILYSFLKNESLNFYHYQVDNIPERLKKQGFKWPIENFKLSFLYEDNPSFEATFDTLGTIINIRWEFYRITYDRWMAKCFVAFNMGYVSTLNQIIV